MNHKDTAISSSDRSRHHSFPTGNQDQQASEHFLDYWHLPNISNIWDAIHSEAWWGSQGERHLRAWNPYLLLHVIVIIRDTLERSSSPSSAGLIITSIWNIYDAHLLNFLIRIVKNRGARQSDFSFTKSSCGKSSLACPKTRNLLPFHTLNKEPSHPKLEDIQTGLSVNTVRNNQALLSFTIWHTENTS